MNTYGIIGLSLYFILYIVFAYKTEKFLKNVLISALVGSGIYLLFHFFGGYLGFSMPLNLYSLLTSVFGGIPGVIILLLCNFVF